MRIASQCPLSKNCFVHFWLFFSNFPDSSLVPFSFVSSFSSFSSIFLFVLLVFLSSFLGQTSAEPASLSLPHGLWSTHLFLLFSFLTFFFFLFVLIFFYSCPHFKCFYVRLVLSQHHSVHLMATKPCRAELVPWLSRVSSRFVCKGKIFYLKVQNWGTS